VSRANPQLFRSLSDKCCLHWQELQLHSGPAHQCAYNLLRTLLLYPELSNLCLFSHSHTHSLSLSLSRSRSLFCVSLIYRLPLSPSLSLCMIFLTHSLRLYLYLPFVLSASLHICVPTILFPLSASLFSLLRSVSRSLHSCSLDRSPSVCVSVD